MMLEYNENLYNKFIILIIFIDKMSITIKLENKERINQ